jgi:hypothetical protein
MGADFGPRLEPKDLAISMSAMTSMYHSLPTRQHDRSRHNLWDRYEISPPIEARGPIAVVTPLKACEMVPLTSRQAQPIHERYRPRTTARGNARTNAQRP